MAIGPVQLLVLGFNHPDFHGEIINELERLRESDTVRVIDSLVVYKDPDGAMEVEHLSNLTTEEAIELGSKVGALVGLGIEGEEGMEAGAEAGAEAAAEGISAFSDEGAGRPRGHPQRLGGCAHPARAPLGRAPARRHRPRRRLPHQRRVHQPARSRRDRPAHRRGGEAAPRPGERLIPTPTTSGGPHVRITQGRTPHSTSHRPPRLPPPLPVTAAGGASG